MKHQSFNELLEHYESAMDALGLGYSTRLESLTFVGKVIRYHETKGFMRFDNEIIASYLRESEQGFYDGSSSKRKYNKINLHIRRFMEFYESGVINTESVLKGSRCSITPEFERIADLFLTGSDFHLNTKSDMRWVSHKYFEWLTASGYENMSDIGVEQLQKFLLDCSKKYAPSSVHNIRLYLKKLYLFLYKEKLSPSPYSELLSFRVNRESKIFPAMPMNDVAKLLAVIDRKTPSGKRAYAAMVLGAELALRACDVANLKLDDIDWVRGELNILQLKTKKTVILPLTQKVGEALRDYILNARPKTSERHIFLRSAKPHTPLKSAVSIGEIYRDCCKAAGLTVNTRFHTLRRSLATAMVTNGIEVTDVAQVLGDNQIDSTKKYISLDTVHLKRCALSFEGIAPATIGGGTQ